MFQANNPFEIGTRRYKRDRSFSFGDDPEYTVSQRALATGVGLIAIFLPVVLLLGHWWWDECFFYSISHFYYSRYLGSAFVASLAFVGTFLLAYRGHSRGERNLATLAGICALAVAVVPTSGPGCNLPVGGAKTEVASELFVGRSFGTFPKVDTEKLDHYTKDGILVQKDQRGERHEHWSRLKIEFKFTDKSDYIHYGSAFFLFLFLAYYAFFVFTRPHDEGADPSPQKRVRNLIYNWSAVAIAFAIVAVGGKFLYERLVEELAWWDERKLTFWAEVLALWAFGVSWVIKGRLFGFLLVDNFEKT